jgi:lysozyme family protein
MNKLTMAQRQHTHANLQQHPSLKKQIDSEINIKWYVFSCLHFGMAFIYRVVRVLCE